MVLETEEKPVEKPVVLQELFIPTNENMQKNLHTSLTRLYGEYVTQEIERHSRDKEYVIHIAGNNGDGSGIVSYVRAAEEIPKEILDKSGKNKAKGITGSDFLLEELYKRPSWGFKTNGNAIDPRYIYPEAIDTYREYVFDEDKKLVPKNEAKERQYVNGKLLVVRFLDQGSTPRMCILGANDRNMDEIIEQRKKEGKKVKVVFENRFRNIAKAVLDNLGIDYDPDTVVRKAESYINRPIYLPDGRDRTGDYDIGIEIGETFNTARANNLKPYMELFKTYPVEISCYKN